jgi:hypothetical protein
MANLRDTPSGYNPYSVLSVLQKCIRRGKEYEAYWWAHELAINQQATAAWNRLATIACEDIGMGNPSAVAIVHACRETWDRVNYKGKEMGKWEWSILAHAVIVLCRSPKTRSADDLSHLVWLRKEGRDPLTREPCEDEKPERLSIPPYAMDMHTNSGKRRLVAEAASKGVDSDAYMTVNFREVSARLDNPIKDVSNDGTNWTEEVCRLQGADSSVALAPCRPDEDAS